MRLIKMAVAGAAGYALYKYATREQSTTPAFATGESGSVRNAGAESMRDTPDQWQKTDEASDESFPASDPPATY